MQRLTMPLPVFTDRDGSLLDGGKVFIGAAGVDPETTPKTVYWDAALTVVASQPLLTLGGKIVNESVPSPVYIPDGDYSIKVENAYGVQIEYLASTQVTSATYQPLNTDLSAIAALGTTAFGRKLLTLANQAALQAAVGGAASLPLSGGTMTGDIKRQNSGTYIFNSDPASIGGAIFVTSSGAADPTVNPGDLWLQTS